MRVAIDAYPMTGRPTGMGQYVARLVQGLGERGEVEDIGCYLLSWRRPEVRLSLPDKARLKHWRLPGGLVRCPPINGALSAFAGSWDICQETNYRPVPLRARARVTVVYDLIFEVMPESFPPDSVKRFRRDLSDSLGRSDKVVAISQATRRDLLERYPMEAEKVEVIYPAVVPREPMPPKRHVDSVREKFGLNEGYILYLGTVESRKNLASLVRAVSLVLERSGRGLQLVLAGKRGYGAQLVEREIEKSGISGRALLLDYVGETEKAALLAGASVFVYPSLYEGFGIPALEAMASGVPVIVSRSSSLPEAAGDCALSVDPHDEVSMAEAIIRLLEDASLRAKMIECGRNRVRHFSTGEMAASFAKLYRSLL